MGVQRSSRARKSRSNAGESSEVIGNSGKGKTKVINTTNKLGASIREKLKDVPSSSRLSAGESSDVRGPSLKGRTEPRKTTKKFVTSIQEKLEDVLPLSSDTSIFRVPRALRKVNEEAYTPQVVSIGPYHHGSERVQAMEAHKMRYLSDFFGRGPKSRLEDFVQNLKELEESARQCYGEPIDEDNDTFVEIMLLDGCFVIELFFKIWEFKAEVVKGDPLFRNISMITAIRVDMLLLENQLPLFILKLLFSLHTGEKYTGGSFIDHILNFFNFKCLLNMSQDAPRSKVDGTYHFLDLLRECCLPLFPNTPSNDWNEDCKFIPSATELHDAGVKFKKGTGTYFLDLKFSSNGVFEIPALIFEDTTEVLFRNLIAFEQCTTGSDKQYITHYLALMDFLINSPKDVATLRRCGIVENLLGDDEQDRVQVNQVKPVSLEYHEHFTK